MVFRLVLMGLIFVFSIVQFTIVGSANPGIVPGQANSAAQIAANRIKAMMEATKVPGLAVSIAVDGKIVMSEGFGKANLEQNVPVTRDSRFRLASVSKVVTAAAVARLVDSGKLDLDKPISEYLPDLPTELGGITTRQLTGHLGGIRHYATKDFVPSPIDFRHFNSVKSSLILFKNDPLVNAPGASYKYSTFGYTLIAAVIEGASKQSYLEYLDTEVFKKLNMTTTGPDVRGTLVPNRVGFYQLARDSSYRNAPYVDPSYKWAGGGLVSSADDLVKFGIAHLNEGFLTGTTLNEMFTSQKTADGKETGVGIGWRISKGIFGNTIIHHEGSMQGARSALLIYPKQKMVIAFMSNLSGKPTDAFSNAQLIAEPFLKKNGAGMNAFKPAGEFDIKGMLNRREASGTVIVIKTPRGFGGEINLSGSKIPVIDVIPHPKGYQLVFVHPRAGLQYFPFIKKGDGFSTGKVGGFSFEITRRGEIR